MGKEENQGICKECGETMAASSLRYHMERAHDRVLPQVRGVYVGGGGLEVHNVPFTRILRSVECPVEECLAKAKIPGKAKGTLYVSSLEIEGGHIAGETGTVTVV